MGRIAGLLGCCGLALAGCSHPAAARGPRGFFVPSEGRVVELSDPWQAATPTTELQTPGHGILNEAGTLSETHWGQLAGPLVHLGPDSARAVASGTAVFPVEAVRHFEERWGQIPVGAWVLLDPGADWERPVATAATLEFLCRERSIAGIATPRRLWPSGGLPEDRKILADQRVLLVEQLASWDQLPPIGSLAVVVPFGRPEDTCAPVRLVAFVPRGVARNDPR